MKGQKLIGFFFDCQIYLLFFIALQKKLKNLFAETDVKYFLQKLKRKGDFSNGMKKAIWAARKGCRESWSMQFGRVVQNLVLSLI